MATRPAEPKDNADIRARVEVAKSLLGLDGTNTQLWKVKTPGYGGEHAWSGVMYDVRFIEGVGVTPDESVARRIVEEFPGYELVEC